MKSGLPVSVEHLLRRTPVETLRLEFKATWDEQTAPAALKTMCAFANDLANVGGGYLLVGVEEHDGVPILPPRGVSVERLDATMKAIANAAHTIRPRYQPIIDSEEIEGRWVIAIWCRAGDNRPYEAPDRSGDRSRSLAWVRLGNLTQRAEGELKRQLDEVCARVPFDDRVAEGASVDDISPALVYEHLRDTGSRLANERRDPVALYRNLQLIRGQNGHAAPRNFALLFFALEPRRFFRGAAIDIVQFPEGRVRGTFSERTIEGPLASQVRSALEALRALIPIAVRKRPDRAEADSIEAWPFAAVEEAIVNAVHHRGYDNPEPTKVEVLPDGLRIVSYPGPVAGMSAEHLEAPDPPLAPGRNRRVGELLKDLRLAEARGTGLSTIRAAMERNGSPPPRFSFDAERTWFEVFLPIHPHFLARSTSVRAQPLRLGRPAPPEEVVGREELVERALRVLEFQSVVLVGPPGRGVSSVLGQLASRLKGPALLLDLQGVTTSGLIGGLGFADMEPSLVPSGSVSRGSLPDMLASAAKRGVTLIFDHVDEFGDPEDLNRGEDRWAVLEDLLRSDVRVVLAASSPDVFSEQDRQAWSRRAEVLHVPPLTEAATRELAGRLLAGLAVKSEDALLFALQRASGGIPHILGLLMRAAHSRQSWTPEGVERALEALLTDPRDPTGLAARCSSLAWLAREHDSRAILDGVASEQEGLRRVDLLARVVGMGRSRLAVALGLKSLEDEGWLTEVDGLVRFEHPILREEWISISSRPKLPHGDDVPF